ncbi:ORF6N domain-containing protein [uncultured Arcobacter sp.]|uniref:ORF6N domain-containing protein n=1 Tax=uncultured Arcobacter sp. TaxID=165434 RepID=UPI00260C7E9C|nr:ORF6N domain-containing protein [uncultured Arcobacter sp.]
MQEITTTTNIDIKSKIYTIRDKQVMLDGDLAELYDVETRVFNQAVKRNTKRFPESFRFQLTKEEYENLKSQIVTSSLSEHGGRRYIPYVFTEQGVSMLSAVLNSRTAIEVSIKIINSFVAMRQFISQNALIFQKVENLELKLLKHDEKFDKVFEALENKNPTQSQGIFYNGQIFDAHNFVSDLIRKAKNSIVLIDNYVDDSTLLLFSKNQNIDVTIYTDTFTKALKLDLEKYNKQYKDISIETNKKFHDRFLIIDNKDVYHIGASLKDLGKKTFAFSKLEDLAEHLLENI